MSDTKPSTDTIQSIDSPVLPKKVFWSRLRSFFTEWKKGGKLFGSSGNTGSSVVDTIIISYGKLDDTDDYNKYKVIQSLFLGVEADDTHFVFSQTDNTLYLLTGAKKCIALDVLGTIEPNAERYKLKLIQTDKSDNNAANIEQIISIINKSSNSRVGVMGNKIYQSDDYANKTCKSLATALAKYELIDITTGISSFLSIKDSYAIDNIRIASQHTTNILKRILLPKIENVLDEGSTIKHSELADMTDDAIRDASKHKFNDAISYDDIESCYTPIIQSGWSTSFDLKPSSLTITVSLNNTAYGRSDDSALCCDFNFVVNLSNPNTRLNIIFFCRTR